MSTISQPLILAVSMTPNPVEAGKTFLMSVQIEEVTHEYWGKFTHQQVSAYTHHELGGSTQAKITLADGKILKDSTGAYIVPKGGGNHTSAYTGAEIDSFINEVKNNG